LGRRRETGFAGPLASLLLCFIQLALSAPKTLKLSYSVISASIELSAAICASLLYEKAAP
jgi:hypothetical protein